MQQETANYSSLASPPQREEMNRASSAPTEPKGYWIGLKIQIKTQALNININHDSDTIAAVIHDYNMQTNKSQIWIHQQSAIYVDHINLDQTWHNIIDNIYENKDVSIPVNNKKYVPLKLDISAQVLIKTSSYQLKGSIDAYDSISKRYHISYHANQNVNSSKMSEWFWCTESNTNVLSSSNNSNSMMIPKQINAPPFDTKPYGLSPDFVETQSQINSRKRTIRTLDNENNNNNTDHNGMIQDSINPTSKRRKLNDSSPMGRIPKNKNISSTKQQREQPDIDTRDIISISSTSASPPKTV